MWIKLTPNNLLPSSSKHCPAFLKTLRITLDSVDFLQAQCLELDQSLRIGRAREGTSSIEIEQLRSMASTQLRFSILLIHPLRLVFSVCLLLAQNFFAKGTTTGFSYDEHSFYSPSIALFQNAIIDNLHDLCIVDSTSGGVGRAFYPQPVHLRNSTTNSVLSFSTEFQFHVGGDVGLGYGLAFVMAPDNITVGQGGGCLGWISNTTDNSTSGHNFAVEFDIFQNSEFNDFDNNHVGVNVNSLNSIVSESAAMYVNSSTLTPIVMAGAYIYAWIEYNGALNVTISDDPNVKPTMPLISVPVDLKDVLDFMYVGFTSATIPTAENGNSYVFSWKFSTSIPSPGPRPGLRKSKIVIPISVSLSLLSLFLIISIVVFHHRHQQKQNANREKMSQMTELDLLPDHYGAHKLRYKDLRDATGKFSEKQKLGKGGFGWVYKGVMPGKLLGGLWETPGNNVEVAVKRIGKTSKQGPREFMAEVKIIGRMRHRNLVPLLGWCHHKSKGELLLVYEYMPKGSLDNLLFHKNGNSVTFRLANLWWEQRFKILMGVATALQFLHEDSELCVLHRDVKASNVMLDAHFNARLGDFGLARSYDHNQGPQTTRMLAGTLGYMAPELFEDGMDTKKTDVYGFGALALEIATGYQATERHQDGKFLVDWVWSHFSLSKIMDVADSSLGTSYEEKEMELVLHMGLLCSHVDPDQRPTMRQILSYLRMEAPFPIHMLPQQRPLCISSTSGINQIEDDASKVQKREISHYHTAMTSDQLS